ncbi:hypothetical protein IQ62_22185 [Streptomyces scabiei]|uniref:hypothetical protein n=1 Tax=Streptomyces scabiei TaxID=1930 RepID=UPI0004E6FD76|nr:hypothetical protein [Streptomyces scabiei]KFF98868.1 hypothetical protein IQ62_22185 [Streptomyces scabiei]
MQLRALRRMRLQVAELATQDSALLEAVRRRRRELEDELSAVRSREDVLAGMADSSEGLLVAVDRQIERRRADTGRGPDVSAGTAEEASDGGASGAHMTVPEAIRLFLREREEATTKEIADHIKKVRPDVNIENLSSTLSRLKNERGLRNSRL